VRVGWGLRLCGAYRAYGNVDVGYLTWLILITATRAM